MPRFTLLIRVREIRGTAAAGVERNAAISPFKWNNYERKERMNETHEGFREQQKEI